MSKGKLALMAIVALAIIGTGLYAVVNSGKTKTGEVAVNVAKVEKTALKSSIFANGKVTAAEERNVFSELMTGKLETVNVKEGDSVLRGQVLAILNTSDLDDQLKSAKIQLAIAQENLKQLVTAGKTNFDLTLQTAQKNVKDAEKSLSDKTQLFDSGAITQAEVDAAKTALDRAKTELENAQRNYSNYGKESQIEIAKLNVKSAQSGVDKIVRDINKKYIKSPIDGVIFKANAKAGDPVSQSAPLFSVTSQNKLQVECNVSEYDIDAVTLGMNAVVTGDGFEDVYSGKVSYISPVAESVLSGQATETIVKVKIAIQETQTKFKPNFSANIEIQTASLQDVLTIPYETIYTEKDGTKFVFVVTDGKLVKKAIKTGVQGDMVVEVRGNDLQEGNTLVLNPTDALKEGETVKVMGGDGK